MNESNRLTELEDVLDALVASEDSPEPAVLDRWIRDYPQFERELVDFVASWTLMNSAVSFDPDHSPEVETEKDHDTFVLRGMSIVQNLLHEMSLPPESPRQLESLVGAAKAAGMSLKEVAREVHLGDAVLRKLDRRLIQFTSIPEEALADIAQVLRCPVGALSEYLQQPPTFAAGAHYRASRAPQLAEPEDFILAVQRDPTMSTEDRRRWLGAMPNDRD